MVIRLWLIALVQMMAVAFQILALHSVLNPSNIECIETSRHRICGRKYTSHHHAKQEQMAIKDLLLSNQIDKGLLKIDQLIRNSYDLKEKDNLVKLYTYISRNRLGITNQFKLKDKEIERAGAIESNVRKVISARFKKRGMSWSKPGALALLKIKETILNGEWDDWWEIERERNIRITEFKPPLPAACFKKETETSPLIEVSLPALRGPDQGKPWVGVLRRLSEAGYYN